MAERYGACVVGSSYNEPLITAEWAIEVFRAAKHRGLRTAFISNGNATREVLEYLQPCTDCYKVDLKSMRDLNYRRLGGAAICGLGYNSPALHHGVLGRNRYFNRAWI